MNEQLLRLVVEAADDDLVMALEVYSLVKLEYPDRADSDNVEAALWLIQEGLRRDLVQAGEVLERVFVPWDLSPAHVNDLIRRRWYALGLAA